MRKLLSMVLAVMLIFSCTVMACAESMQISTNSGDAVYQLAFPADTEIPWESEMTAVGNVTATKMLIEPKKTVKVSVSSENSYRLVNVKDSASAIAYTLTGADSIAFLPGEVGKSYPLSVEIGSEEWAKAASGEHRDVLVFTMEYTDA